MLQQQSQFNTRRISEQSDKMITVPGKSFYVIPIRILKGSQPSADGVSLELGSAYFCSRPTSITFEVEILFIIPK